MDGWRSWKSGVETSESLLTHKHEHTRVTVTGVLENENRQEEEP